MHKSAGRVRAASGPYKDLTFDVKKDYNRKKDMPRPMIPEMGCTGADEHDPFETEV